ncbi:hypothetical protein [Lacipirellula limnantheis]|uniref:PEP-CTERM protein-sorting domain-containing protein n=1 Tax=Lacipirellula limnantheis TaxID=2528024 RepID=A0A517TYB6_9BACT|nr:hypothetical protein [Lacipirellula limnantheis]QDT73361.1 hypothetical protein I41_25500 [Lacipirellula limnantheis]
MKYLFAIALIGGSCCFPQLSHASINISLNPSNLVPNSTKISFVTGAVDPSGGNSGFLGSIYTNDGTLLQQWETFCVETQEFVELDNRKYLLHSSAANPTTSANNVVGDTAKWIYYQFGHGGLAGWTPNDGEEVQEAIWSQVTKPDSSPLAVANGLALTWVNDAIAAFNTNYAAAKAKADQIRILNPITLDGTHKQSMLYAVPEASTVAVWSILTFLGAGLAYRKRSLS